MAVELRCPDCRAKLTLKKAPEPGSEVECPECYAVFDAPDDAGGDDAPPPRAKKRPADDDGDDDRPKKKKAKAKKEKAPAPGADPKAPKKRKAKKKETNQALLTMLIVGGVLFLCLVGFMLYWYFSRKPAAYELMNYLPADSTSVQGANLGHVRRYTELYKKFEANVNGTEFKKAGDAAAKAVGADANEFIDYMVTGANSKGESAIVLKSRAEFDGSLLSKLPGAKSGTANGRTYYTVDPIPGVYTNRLKVFSPTSKIVVVCPEAVSAGTFNKMITANDGDASTALPAKLGVIADRATKGTAWTVIVLDTNNRPKASDKDKKADGGGSGTGEYEGQVASNSQSAKAFALKTSVRSRHIRFEAILQFAEPEGARGLYDKFRDSPLSKTDDASQDPPRYWKQFEQAVVQNRKVGTELYSTLSATTSGPLFILSAETETNTIMESSSQLVGKMTGNNAGGGNMGGMGGGAPPMGGGAPPGGPPPGGPPPGGQQPGAVRGPGGGIPIGP